MENKSTNTGQQNSGQGNFNSETGANNLGGLGAMLGGLDFNKLPEMLKGYGTSATKAIGGLSTTQKVVGGALLVLGARYLSKRSNISFRDKLGRKKA